MRPPQDRRYLMSVHTGIWEAVQEGRVGDAQLLLTMAPMEYQAVNALLSWIAMCRKDCPT